MSLAKKTKKVIDPWGPGLVESYEKIVIDFGLSIFDEKMLNMLPNPNRLMRRGVIFAHRDLKRIATAIKKKEHYYVLSGIMPSAEKIHFGNKMVVENIVYFQKNGAHKTFILVADLEAAATRGITIEEAKKRALEFHIPAYVALGLDPEKTIFYFQSENKHVLHLAYEFAKRITLNEFRAIYGNADPSRIMAALTQAGDILFPQLEKKMSGIIPVGIDQDPHVRLSRDIVRRTKEKYNFILPSSMYHKYTPSLDGSVKMSKSAPGSYISLPEAPGEACKKLKNAVTGGRKTVEEQRKKGGIPEKCMVFEMFKQHLVDNDNELHNIYKECKTGKRLCGECKEQACKLISAFLKRFDADVEKARANIKRLHFIEFK